MNTSKIRKRVCSLAAALALCAPALVSRAQYSNAVMNLNPILYYQLNDTTPIPSPEFTNAGSAEGLGTALGVWGLNVPDFQYMTGPITAEASNQVGHFNGSSAYAAIPYCYAMDPSSVGPVKQNQSAPFTIEVWLNPDGLRTAYNSDETCPITWGDFSANRTGWLIYQQANPTNAAANVWEWRLYSGSGAGFAANGLIDAGNPAPGTWDHVALVWDGANASIYVDGVLAAGPNAVPSFAPVVPTRQAMLGFRSDFNFPWAGGMANLAVYTNALSQSVLLSHYQNATNSASTPRSYEALVQALHPLVFLPMNDAPYNPSTTQPVAQNLGSLGSPAYDATYWLGQDEVPGVPFAGFASNHTAVNFDGLAYVDSGVTNAGVMIPPLTGVVVNQLTFTGWFYNRTVEFRPFSLFTQRATDNESDWLAFWFTSPTVLATSWSTTDGGTTGEWLQSYTPTLDPPIGAWSFVAAVWSPTNTTIYVNGVSSSLSEAQIGGARGMRDFGALGPLWLGFDAYPNGSGLDGILDEVAVYTNALTAAQIQSLVNASGVLEITSVTQSPPAPNYEGQTITLAAAVFASQTGLSEKWYKNGLPLASQTTSTLTLNNVSTNDSGNYDLVVSNSFGVITSSVVPLTVVAGPAVISQQPESATRYAGGYATFRVVAGGTVPLSYQWQYDNSPISGATTTSLTLTGVQSSNVGSYNVLITNPHGTVPSSNAVLTVISSGTNYPGAVVEAGPAGYWRFGETNGTTAYDYFGGNDGVIVGGVTNGVPGPSAPAFPGLESNNVAFAFDGTDSDVATPLAVNGHQGTFLVLINPSIIPQTYAASIMCARNPAANSDNDCTLNFTGDDTTIQYTWGGDPGTWNFNPNYAPPATQWSFLAAAVDNLQSVMYFDSGSGLQVTTNFHPSVFITNAGPLVIGLDPALSRFTGSMDEVAFFSRALSPAEITCLDQVLYTGLPQPPALGYAPLSQTTPVGVPVTFSLNAEGALPLSYQWQVNGANIPGANSSSYTLASPDFANSGASYQVIVTNSLGAATSSPPAMLTVVDPPIPGNVSYQLLMHLKFDGDLLDATMNGHDGTAIGSPTFVPGVVGSSAIQVSTDLSGPIFNNVVVSNVIGLPFGPSNSFSVAFWVNYTTPGGTGNDTPMICDAIQSTSNPGWVLTDDAGKIMYSFKGTENGLVMVGDAVPLSPVNDGNWHHIVMTIDRVQSQAIFYVDGGSVTTISVAGLGGLNCSCLGIGSDPTGAYASGSSVTYNIDDVGIWGRALTSAEVAGIYSAGTNGHSFDSYGPVQLTIVKTGTGQLQITWQQGTLESAPALTGPWTAVGGATAPLYVVTPGGTPTFYRVQ